MVVCVIVELLRNLPLAHTVPLKYLFQELYASRFHDVWGPVGHFKCVSEAALSALMCSSPVPGYLFTCKTIMHPCTSAVKNPQSLGWQSRLDLATKQQQNRTDNRFLRCVHSIAAFLFSLSPWCFGGWTIPSTLFSETVVSHSVSEWNEELRWLIHN